MNSYYLTDEDFKTAEANGIPNGIVYNRFYTYGWKKEKALTETYRPRPKTHVKYKEELKKSGVNLNTFYMRIGRGWDAERAATEPTMTKKEAAAYASKVRIANQNPNKKIIITPEVKATAEKNGIPLGTLRTRIYRYKWSVQRAMTEPVHSRFNWRDQK